MYHSPTGRFRARPSRGRTSPRGVTLLETFSVPGMSKGSGGARRQPPCNGGTQVHRKTNDENNPSFENIEVPPVEAQQRAGGLARSVPSSQRTRLATAGPGV